MTQIFDYRFIRFLTTKDAKNTKKYLIADTLGINTYGMKLHRFSGFILKKRKTGGILGAVKSKATGILNNRWRRLYGIVLIRITSFVVLGKKDVCVHVNYTQGFKNFFINILEAVNGYKREGKRDK